MEALILFWEFLIINLYYNIPQNAIPLGFRGSEAGACEARSALLARSGPSQDMVKASSGNVAAFITRIGFWGIL